MSGEPVLSQETHCFHLLRVLMHINKMLMYTFMHSLHYFYFGNSNTNIQPQNDTYIPENTFK